MWKCARKRGRFRRDALAAWSNYQTTGVHVTAEEADAWLAKLEAGKKAAPRLSTLVADRTGSSPRERLSKPVTLPRR